ncbi:TPA: GntR family transcriptional regulator [Klebsiella michiganensis]|nr:GntR family transcriptional regulator [Klebsiella michiganensis]
MEKVENEKHPKYLIIINYIIGSINKGELLPGTKLPSELTMAKKFATTRSTVVRAFQQLAFDGYISREQGRGTFIKHLRLPTTLDMSIIRSFEEEIIEMGAQVEYRLISFVRCQSPVEVRTKLMLVEGAEIYHLKRLRLVNNVSAVLENRYISLQVGEYLSINNLLTMPMYEILNKVVGRPVTHVDGVIRVMAATKEIAAHLGIKPATPLLVRDYVLMNQEHGPLMCGEAYYLEQYPVKYRIKARTIPD